MAVFEAEPAVLVGAGSRIGASGAEVVDGMASLARALALAGEGAGEASVADAASACAGRLTRLLLAAGRGGIDLGGQAVLAAEGYAAVERGTAAALRGEPAP